MAPKIFLFIIILLTVWNYSIEQPFAGQDPGPSVLITWPAIRLTMVEGSKSNDPQFEEVTGNLTTKRSFIAFRFSKSFQFIDYKDIETVGLLKDYKPINLSRDGIYITEKDGQTHLFVTDGNKELVKSIRSLIEASTEDPLVHLAQQNLPRDTPLPRWVDPEQTSDDPTYGYTRENPIRVGGPEGFSGPASENLYLRHLRDWKLRPLSFRRIGSVSAGEDGHILDRYELTDGDGKTFVIYIDMYHEDIHPFEAKAPKGFYFWK
jgi:hypothetical protein